MILNISTSVSCLSDSFLRHRYLSSFRRRRPRSFSSTDLILAHLGRAAALNPSWTAAIAMGFPAAEIVDAVPSYPLFTTGTGVPSHPRICAAAGVRSEARPTSRT